jgi:hypothetical protein
VSAPAALTAELQRQCSEWGAYWRASDSHGVELTKPQAIELLETALRVEVEIKDNGCIVCDGTGAIDGQPCPDCAPAAQPGEAEPVEPRCNLCRYKHGHCIGCPNNPVDLALAEKVNAAIEAHRAAPAQAAAVPEAVEAAVALREALEYAVKHVPELATVPGIAAALSQGEVSGEGEGRE